MARKFSGPVAVADGKEGIELPDLEAALKVAAEMAKKIIAHDSAAGIYSHDKAIEISDADGNVVHVLRFKDLQL